ncbi:MAG: acetylesterase [Lachnospiraceae bacterium]|nr:acetylesterase [Lachnospiraceae bacterium]
MASGRMEFHARTIMQHANFCFVLPNDVEMAEVFDKRHYERGTMNLILLHGLTGTDTDWLYGGNAQEMAIQYNLNIFMPTTGNSFYLDRGYKGGQYAAFIAEELPDYIRTTFGIEMKRENTLIGGLSMGGYGSLHIALAYPDRYRACIALSSAMHVEKMAEWMKNDEDLGLVPNQMRREMFGDPDKLLASDKNPKTQYLNLRAAGADIPEIYIACGTKDVLLEVNRDFRDFLKEQGADFTYEEGFGAHNWTFWREYLDRGLRTLLTD